MQIGETATGGEDAVMPAISSAFLQCCRRAQEQPSSSSVAVAVDARELAGKFR